MLWLRVPTIRTLFHDDMVAKGSENGNRRPDPAFALVASVGLEAEHKRDGLQSRDAAAIP